MNPTGEALIQVPFHDVDIMGVVWHGHYYKYFELARTDLFRKLHCDVDDLRAMGLILPVIESHCRYVAPLIYGLSIRVVATLVESEFRLGVDYLVTEAASSKRLAKGKTLQVVLSAQNSRMMMPVPEKLAKLLAIA